MNVLLNQKIIHTRLGNDPIGIPTYILSLEDGTEVVIPHPFYESLGKPTIGEMLLVTVSTKQSEENKADV